MFWRILLFCFLVVSLVGCKNKEALELANQLEEAKKPISKVEVKKEIKDKKSRIRIEKKTDPLSVIKSYPSAEIAWLYDKYGRSTWYYEPKLTDKSFTTEDYFKLIKIAYTTYSSDDSHKKHSAVFALQYSLFRFLHENTSSTKYKHLKEMLYSAEFLEEAVTESPSLVQYLPESLPNFQDLVILSLQSNPHTFQHLPLRYKHNPEVITTLFQTQEFLLQGERFFKKQAASYAKKEQALYFLSQDGLLLEDVYPTFKDDADVVMTAIKQNPVAINFASKRLQSIFKQSGRSGLKNSQKDASSSKLQYNIEYQENGDIVKVLKYKEYRGSVHDDELIKEIEKNRKRRLLECYKIADIPTIGHVYVATFEPNGKNHLGGFIFEKDNGEFIFKDYPAIKKNNEGIWFAGDGLVFSPENFKLLRIIEKKGAIEFELIWKRGSFSKAYTLIEKESFFDEAELTF